MSIRMHTATQSSQTLTEMQIADELVAHLGPAPVRQLLDMLRLVEAHGYGGITLHVNQGRVHLIESAMRYTVKSG